MTPASLAPTIAGPGRLKLRTAAEDMQNAVEDRAARTGVPVPPYEFLEMIGKGSFGQVFKWYYLPLAVTRPFCLQSTNLISRKRDTNELFAVKIIDVDTSDYRSDPSLRDEAINDFVREIAVLQQLKDARARNINVFYEALPLHSQLWLVSDYCGGGSVHTVMKALPQGFGLEEMFIIPITREVGIALRHVHEAGIIHRDLKCMLDFFLSSP